MKDNIILYKDFSNPLEKVETGDTKVGEIYIASNGVRFKKIDNIRFEIITDSPLNENEVIEELSVPKGLELLWKLVKKMR